jgi:two-component system sensor histidine kinase ChvG
MTVLKRSPPFIRKRFSPLTVRILAVNMLALFILAGSLLFLGQYQERLIQSELEGLTFEARIFANALGEGAVIDSDEEHSLLAPELARSMVRRLVEASDSRVRLFDTSGELLADSRMLASRKQAIQIELIAPPAGSWLEQLWQEGLAWAGRWLPQSQYPLYNEKPEQEATHYTIARQALQGTIANQLWHVPHVGLLLGVAVPVQAYKQVLGSVMVTRSSARVDAAVADVRGNVLEIFCAVLALTILLSLYLARTIVAPLQSLARAVRAVKQDQLQVTGLGGAAALLANRQIPDMTQRGDEVGELSHALREMTTALAVRLGAIENFAADVAHEIKNPLTSLRSAVETAARIKDPQRLATLMGVIHDDVQRMDRLITDIASASRLDAELSRTEATPIHLRQMLELLVSLYASVDTEVAVVLTTTVPESWVVLGVEGRLMQVLRNLVENARSFTPKGGTVRVSAVEESGQVLMRVEDDGPGIPATKLEAIFDRFYSERPAQEKFGQHSGLGLSIARQIVAAHRGTIQASNRKDADGASMGACFTVTLPLVV